MVEEDFEETSSGPSQTGADPFKPARGPLRPAQALSEQFGVLSDRHKLSQRSTSPLRPHADLSDRRGALSDRRRPSQTKRTQPAIGGAAALAALAVAPPALHAAGFSEDFFASWLVAVEYCAQLAHFLSGGRGGRTL